MSGLPYGPAVPGIIHYITFERFWCIRWFGFAPGRQPVLPIVYAALALGLFMWIDPATTYRVKQQSLRVCKDEVRTRPVSNVSVLNVGVVSPPAMSAFRHELDALSVRGLVLVGIFCRADDYVKRNIYRSTSSELLVAGITQRFIICGGEEGSALDALNIETLLHTDIIILDCIENMDNGKSFDYFRSIRQHEPSFHFYAKADLDTLILYHNLAAVLKSSPKCHYFLGCILRWEYLSFGYPNGAMYVLSSDLVQVLETCDTRCKNVAGPEDREIMRVLDQLAHDRLQWGDICDNAVMHFSPRPGEADMNALHERMIYIHGLKDPEIMWKVFTYYVSLLSNKGLSSFSGKEYLSPPHRPSFIWDPQCIGLTRPKES